MSGKETLRRPANGFHYKENMKSELHGLNQAVLGKKKNPFSLEPFRSNKVKEIKRDKDTQVRGGDQRCNRTLQHIKGSVSSGSPDLIWFSCNKIRFGITMQLNVPTSKSDLVTEQHVIIQWVKPLLWWATQRKGREGPAPCDLSVCMFAYEDGGAQKKGRRRP